MVSPTQPPLGGFEVAVVLKAKRLVHPARLWRIVPDLASGK